MDSSFELDMATLVVARIVTVLVFAAGVTIMTLRRSQRETVLFCYALASGIMAWVTAFVAARTGLPIILAAHVAFVAATVSLQLAAMAALCGRRVHPALLVIAPLGAFVATFALDLSIGQASSLSAVILVLQLSLVFGYVVAHGGAVIRLRTAILMALGYALSLASAVARIVGTIYWPELLVNPLSSMPANTLPFLASYLGTILITLSWVAALKDRAEAALSDLANRDELTGLANRRQMRLHGGQLWRQARQQGTACTLIVIDIDHFKSVNDRWGHDEGDRVLLAFSEALRRLRPEPQLVARMGGEEFCLLLLGIEAQGAHQVSEMLRYDLERHVLLPNGLPVRFSAGIAQATLADDSVEAAYRRADHALYQAKASGRDCAIIAQEPLAA